MAKSGIFFSPANHVKELAKLKLFKTAPKILKDIRDCSKQLENRKLASWKRNKLKQALQHYSREFEKQLEDGKIEVRDVESWCENEDSWDVLSGGIIKINDSLALDVADCDKRISDVNHYWDFKTPSSSSVVEGFETDPESMSKGVGARLGFLVRKFPKENNQADLEKQLEDWTKAAAKKSGGDPDKLLKAAKEAFKQTLDGKNPAQAAGLNADSYEIASRFVDNDPVDGIKIDSYSEDAAKKAASKVARGISGQIEDAMSKVDVDGKTISGFDSNVVDLAIKDIGGKPTDVYDVFDRSAGKDKVVLQMRSFLVAAEKDPDKAASDLVRLAHNDEQKKILAAIAAKLKPDTSKALEKAAKSAGVAIDDYDLSQISGHAKAAAKSAAKAAADVAADNEDVQDAASSVFDGAFTSLGYARLAGKVASAALNNGKAVVDAFSGWKIARGEDKNVIAEMKFLVELPDDTDYTKSDIHVAVRFDAADMKWHATCLDDRKLQLPEDVIVKKALATEEGKNFQKKALKTWKRLLDPDSKLGQLFAVSLVDGESLGVKLPGNAKKMADILKKMKDDIPKLEAAFLKESTMPKSFLHYLFESNDDEESKSTKKSTKQLVMNAIKQFGINKAGDWLDELLGGQMKDALIRMYNDEKLANMDEKALEAELAELKKDNLFKQAEKSEQHQDTKDTESEVEIDPESETFSAVWWSKDKSTSVASILNAVVAEVQKKAVSAKKAKDSLPSALKKLGVTLSQEDVDTYGPALAAMVEKGSSKADIEQAVKKMKSEVRESLSRSWRNPSKFILESNVHKRKRRQLRVAAALFESETFLMCTCQQELVAEGFKSLVGKAFNKVSAMIPDKAKQKMKDFGQKALAVVSDRGVSGMLSIAGIATGVLTGGWGAQLAMSAIYVLERHGKNIKATFDRQFAAFKNSKGVIARMDFTLAGKKDARYSMRYYVTDQVWRVLNMADQKKQVKLSRAKAIINGSEGERFRKRLKEIWDPLFADGKGGEIDFEALLSNVQGINIDKKALKLYSDFRNGYDNIVSSCCDTPKIDTRTA